MTTIDDLRGLISAATGRDLTDVAAGTLLFETGVLDSFNALDVIEALEARFAIQFQPEDLSAARLGSLDAIAATLADYLK